MEQETRLSSEQPTPSGAASAVSRATPGPAPATPGTVRPGGRTAKVRAAVLEATQDALAEQGFHALNMDRVAAAAGVGKTTVYRRWGSSIGLITDLLHDMAEQSLPAADTGSLEGDLRANALLVLKTLTDPRMGPVFQAVIASAACDEECAAALNSFYTTRLREWAPAVERAVARGEIPAGTDATEVLRAVSAPLYYRFAISREPLTPADAERAVAVALAGARAGAFHG